MEVLDLVAPEDDVHGHLAAAGKFQQARHDDGHVFAPGENSNPGDEPFCAVTGAEMVSRLYYR